MSTIRVLSSLATRAWYLDALPAFETSTGHEVQTEWDGITELRRRLFAGEAGDVVLGTAALIDECMARGLVRAGSRVDHARSRIGVAVRAGAIEPDISSPEALGRALLAARSVAISSGPSGEYLAGLFLRMGIDQQLSHKLIRTPSGVMVGSLLSSGEAELGFQQIGELLPFRGIRYLGPLPDDVQQIIVFAGGVHAAAGDPPAARELLEFLNSPAASATLTIHGMEAS